jgi:hypothetical protein
MGPMNPAFQGCQNHNRSKTLGDIRRYPQFHPVFTNPVLTPLSFSGIHKVRKIFIKSQYEMLKQTLYEMLNLSI